MLPCIIVYYANKEVFENKPDLPEEEVQIRISIPKLAKFIDAFTYYPLKVNTIHSKNHSSELTYIMTANKIGCLAREAERNKVRED